MSNFLMTYYWRVGNRNYGTYLVHRRLFTVVQAKFSKGNSLYHQQKHLKARIY